MHGINVLIYMFVVLCSGAGGATDEEDEPEPPEPFEYIEDTA